MYRFSPSHIPPAGGSRFKRSPLAMLCLSLALGACSGGGGGDAADDDPQPTLSIAPASGDEGGPINFTVSLSAAQSDEVSFDFATAADSADATDFEARQDRLSIPAGETEVTLSINTIGDDEVEFDETFTVTLSAASDNARFGTSSAQGTIVDDDAYVLSIDPQSIDEGDASGALSFVASLDKPAQSDFSVNISTVNGTAVAGEAAAGGDYAATSGTLNFAAGNLQADAAFQVTVHGDQRLEADETFSLSISNPGANVDYPGAASPAATLRNDDQLQLSIADAAIEEGDSGNTLLSFPLTLSGSADIDIEIGYATADGSATAGDSDYTPADDTLTIAAGQTTGSIAVAVIGDTRAEPDEQFTLQLSDATNGVVLAQTSASGTIRNDDQPALSVADVAQAEGDADGQIVFTVSLDQPTQERIDFNVATSDHGSAVAGEDYTAIVAGSGSITPGNASTSIPVATLGDQVIEPDETFTLTLSNISGPVVVLDAEAIGTLTDDDTRQVSVDDPSIEEGDAGTSTAQFSISLEGPAITDVEVSYESADGSATAGSDYDAVNGAVTIAAGQRSASVDVAVRGDLLVEGDQDFSLLLTAVSDNARIVDSSGSASIVDDDIASIEINSASLFEGDDGETAMQFGVKLSNAFENAVSIPYATRDAEEAPRASEGFDYIASSGELAIPAGQTELSLQVQVRGDFAVEPDERFELALGELPPGAELDVGVGVGVIVDDDVARLSDTAITACADADSYGLVCNDVASGSDQFPGQDAEFGPDAQNPDPADGIAGLSFTKLDDAGTELPADAAQWACVRDNITGLIWEAKSDDGGLRDAAHSYTWYDSDATSNGTDNNVAPPLDGSGTADGGTCADAGRCDTEKFVADVNASNLCGYSDWRLPRVDELRSIIALGGADEGFDVDANYFPLASGNEVVWTDTPSAAASAGNTWAIDFSGGFQIEKPKAEAYSARLVSGTFLRPLDTPIASQGTQSCRDSIRPTAPAERFTDNGDGTVTDQDTGLMWKQCPEGLPGPNCTAYGTAVGAGFDYAAVAYTWQGALQRVQTVNATVGNPDVNPGDYSDWRLPNIKELASILERACVNPALNLGLFPGDYKDRTVNDDVGRTDARFWSSSPDAVDGSRAWVVLSHNGDDLRSAKAESQVPNPGGYSNWVRLVRDAE